MAASVRARRARASHPYALRTGLAQPLGGGHRLTYDVETRSCALRNEQLRPGPQLAKVMYITDAARSGLDLVTQCGR
jgi:hypothetical protein